MLVPETQCCLFLQRVLCICHLNVCCSISLRACWPVCCLLVSLLTTRLLACCKRLLCTAWQDFFSLLHTVSCKQLQTMAIFVEQLSARNRYHLSAIALTTASVTSGTPIAGWFHAGLQTAAKSSLKTQAFRYYGERTASYASSPRAKLLTTPLKMLPALK